MSLPFNTYARCTSVIKVTLAFASPCKLVVPFVYLLKEKRHMINLENVDSVMVLQSC